MTIYVNNQEQEIASQAGIPDVLGMLNMASAKGIAIAVNNNVVPRQEWNTYTLQPHDKVTLIKATQGG